LTGNVMFKRNLHLFGLAIGLALAVGTSNRASSATVYTNAVLADNPVVYWNFDEAGGDAIDQVNGLAADTLVAGASATRVASTTNGGGISLGSAASLSGAGDGKFSAADLTHPGGATQWATEFWAQSGDPGTFNYLLGGGGNGNNPAFLQWGGAMQYYPNGGGVQAPPSLAHPTSSSWQHFVFVVDSDGQTATVYVDGDLWGNQNLGNPADAHPFGRQVVGGHNPGGASAENFSGLIDEVAIYDLSNAGDLGAAGQSIANHYNVPEPASIALLGLGGLLMLRRRRSV
jgi:hypothetical protein